MTCATVGCVKDSTGKSKYCREHRDAARANWLSKVQHSAQERYERDEAHRLLWDDALRAAMEAHKAAEPTPMVVNEHVGLSEEVTRSWYVSEGACGFAWVSVHPGNSSFAIWACKHAGFRKAYGGGVQRSMNFNSQSIERADQAAHAAAEVLRKAGVKAYAGSRLD